MNNFKAHHQSYPQNLATHNLNTKINSLRLLEFSQKDRKLIFWELNENRY